ncbi:sulfite exporter TauE/SafE family protein [Peptacetobacter sp.]|uniref:sulfite exporter TauE/SafE family protein n=1 Tax=Peptacetobacter sp. TaxID=2991975 RepID=UPI00262660B0|nr:sulfite exporter TauE/SafE family protein [Peptacetobacter sp.]
MASLIRIMLIGFTSIFAVVFGRDFNKTKKANQIEDESWKKPGFIGFVANFADTLGIGSFAIVVAMSKALKLNVKDKHIPGMLNVSCTIPAVLEALIFITSVKVDPITLLSLLIAAAAGSVIGAKIISKLDESIVQIVMGIALFITGIVMFLGLPWVSLMPGGGTALGLTGTKLIIAIIGNFILGALMTAGIGLYAPCMAMLYLLGMSERAAYPIMMGSCAMLLPFSGMEFIKEGQYPRKSSLAITLGGIVGVFIAAFIVKSLPINILKVLVICVIFYTATTMLKSGIVKIKENKASGAEPTV